MEGDKNPSPPGLNSTTAPHAPDASTPSEATPPDNFHRDLASAINALGGGGDGDVGPDGTTVASKEKESKKRKKTTAHDDDGDDVYKPALKKQKSKQKDADADKTKEDPCLVQRPKNHFVSKILIDLYSNLIFNRASLMSRNRIVS